MKKLNIITHTDNVKECKQIEVDDELYEFLNIKVNCITKELFEEKLLHYVKKVYSEDDEILGINAEPPNNLLRR